MGAAAEPGRSRRQPPRWALLVVTFGMLAAACGGGEPADSGAAPTGADGGGTAAAESCYEGQTATFVVSFDAGGGYDQIARIIAPALEEELGATVVVENEPGAGGLLAMTSLLRAEPDGLRFAFFAAQGIVGAAVGEAEGADFDLMDFTFVGRVAADQRVLAAGGTSEYETIEDVLAAEGLSYATAGVGAADYIDATVLNPALGLDAEIITGFAGSSETELAVTSGDTDLGSGTYGSRLSALESGDHRPVLSLGADPLPDYPDVPTIPDLELEEESLEIAGAYIDLQDMGRMIWAPPGVPEHCAAELEAAVAAVLEDPAVAEQMAAADQEVDFLGGAEMREIAAGLLESPEAFAELLRGAYEGQ